MLSCHVAKSKAPAVHSLPQIVCYTFHRHSLDRHTHSHTRRQLSCTYVPVCVCASVFDFGLVFLVNFLAVLGYIFGFSQGCVLPPPWMPSLTNQTQPHPQPPVHPLAPIFNPGPCSILQLAPGLSLVKDVCLKATTPTHTHT